MTQPNEIVVPEVTNKASFMSKRYDRDFDKDEQEIAELEAANAPKELTDEEKLEAEPAENAEERSFKKRYGDLRRHSQKSKDEFEDRIAKLESQLTDASRKSIKLPKSDEELEAWSQEYPDVAKIVETIAMKKAAEMNTSLDEKISVLNKKQERASKQDAENELLSFHPDFNEIRDLDSFHEWVEEQPKWVQDALYENAEDARSCARAIDLFKIDVNWGKEKKVAKRKKSERAAASNISINDDRTEIDPTDSSVTFSESMINAMTAGEYEANEEAINAAIMSGKIVYDLSGGAR